jgi:hypothetical protein
VEINELKRGGGGILTLKFSIVNDSAEQFDVYNTLARSAYRSADNVTLVDSVGKKRYFVVTDSEDKPLCSAGIPIAGAGERLALWAKFPAPPDDVEAIGVVIPHFDPIDDVPISGGAGL